MGSAPWRLALVFSLAASAAWAQDRPEPADVERVYVPEEAFKRVVKAHPRGVVLSEEELADLLQRAGDRAAHAKPEERSPLAATVQRVLVRGRVAGEVAELEAAADVAVLHPGTVRLPLPLSGVGLRSVRLGDGERARVIRTARGAEVLLEGSDAGPVMRTVRWSFAVRAEPGDERGSGRLSFPVPACASGKVELDLPGEVEVADSPEALCWTTASGDRTSLEGAFGGAGQKELTISWRPRRSLETVRGYSWAETRSVFLVQPGVVTLETACLIAVHRAARDRFRLRLPAGFVVRELSLAQGELAYVQKDDLVEVRLDAPRSGGLQLVMRAERATGAERGPEQLTLQPVGFEDVDRVSGVVGFAAGAEARVTFGAIEGLERDDLDVLPNRLPAGRLLRVYRRGTGAKATAELTVAPVEPKVDLSIKAALAVDERELRALALYRYEVEAGAVFAVRAWLPPEFAFETATVRDGAGNPVAHQRKEVERLTRARKTPYTEILIELEKGLRVGEALLVTVQATRQVPEGLANRQLTVPRFSGFPASRLHGHIGFAPDEAFRLDGTTLRSLVAIPAEELPRVGIDVAGLVLGYRIEGENYGGRVAVIRKETQLTVEALAQHWVHERVIDSAVDIDLDIEGGPVKELELLLPKGAGLLARITGPDVRPDRELLGSAADGRERWKVRFDERKLGRVSLSVRFATKLEQAEGSNEIKAALPRVSVVGAFSERGTLAVYSSDATEVVGAATGLRTIEVTEVAQRTRREERPLFAYTHIGGDHELLLSIRRPGTGEVLTAVAEQLALETSSGPDGTSRHTATWQLKNLNNQFFALRLPKDAVLWSVVVDGEGVKPAKRDGIELIPIPTAGEKGPGEVTRVTASYTIAGKDWGVLGEEALGAPVLLRGSDPVPVLSTRWALSLPDDYRVIEVDGNLRGPQVSAPRPLMLSLLGLAGEEGWPLGLGLLALLGLLTAASARLRRAGLLLASGGVGAAQGGAQLLAGPGCRRAGLIVLGLLVAVVGLGFCVVSTLVGRHYEDMATAAPRAPMEGAASEPSSRSYDGFGIGGGGGTGGGDYGGVGGEEQELERGLSEQVFKAQAKAENRRSLQRADRQADNKPGRRALRRKGKKVSADWSKNKDGAPPPPPAPPAADAPAPADMDMDDEAAPTPEPSAELLDGLRSRLRPSEPQGPGGGAPPEVQTGAPQKPIIVLEEEAETTADAPHGTDLSSLSNKGSTRQQNLDPNLGSVAGEKAPQRLGSKRFADLGGMGQVGLRSLVMQLPDVGSTYAFERPGGDAQVRLSVVREAALVTASGLLALLAFLAALLLPRVARLSSVGLILLGLVGVTAVAVLLGGAWATPLSNAAALGVVFAAPVAGLLALGRYWETAPLSRLSRAVRALRA